MRAVASHPGPIAGGRPIRSRGPDRERTRRKTFRWSPRRPSRKPTGPNRDHGRSERHRLDGRDPEIFDAGKHERARPGDDRPEPLVVDAPHERLLSEPAFELAAHRPIAYDDDLLPCLPCRLDRDVDPFVRNERRDDDEHLFPSVIQFSAEERVVDERMDDGRFDSVVPTNPVADEGRVRHETIDAIRARAVPLSEKWSESRSGEPHERLRWRKVIVESVPHVTHRRVAVADVGAVDCTPFATQ